MNEVKIVARSQPKYRNASTYSITLIEKSPTKWRRTLFVREYKICLQKTLVLVGSIYSAVERTAFVIIVTINADSLALHAGC